MHKNLVETFAAGPPCVPGDNTVEGCSFRLNPLTRRNIITDASRRRLRVGGVPTQEAGRDRLPPHSDYFPVSNPRSCLR